MNVKVRAALLDAPAASAQGKFLRIDELESEAELTLNHVPTVSECDLPPEKYLWRPATGAEDLARNPAGGVFVAVAAHQRSERVPFEVAFKDFVGAVESQAGVKLPATTKAWLAQAGEKQRKDKGV